jgi:effector-binding domain-containing protein
VIDKPQIVQTAAQAIAVIRLTVPREEIQKVMGPGLGELKAAVAAQRIAIIGPWFTHHLKMPGEVFDFEIGVPVAKPVAAAGRIQPSHRPAMRVARTVYHGPYEGLASAWGEFMAWIAAERHTPTAELWECYLAGPESGSDPAKWRTQLDRPLTR